MACTVLTGGHRIGTGGILKLFISKQFLAVLLGVSLASCGDSSALILDGNPETAAGDQQTIAAAVDWSTIPAGATATGQSVTEVKGFNDGSTYVYFLARGTALGPTYDFFIDSDGNAATGFKPADWSSSGADYLLENGTLYKYAGSGSDWVWTSKAKTGVQVSKSATAFEARIARTALVGVIPASVRYGYQDLDASWSLVSQLPKRATALVTVTSGTPVTPPPTTPPPTTPPPTAALATAWRASPPRTAPPRGTPGPPPIPRSHSPPTAAARASSGKDLSPRPPRSWSCCWRSFDVPAAASAALRLITAAVDAAPAATLRSPS
jgi:hypothetical protein